MARWAPMCCERGREEVIRAPERAPLWFMSATPMLEMNLLNRSLICRSTGGERSLHAGLQFAPQHPNRWGRIRGRFRVEWFQGSAAFCFRRLHFTGARAVSWNSFPQEDPRRTLRHQQVRRFTNCSPLQSHPIGALHDPKTGLCDGVRQESSTRSPTTVRRVSHGRHARCDMPPRWFQVKPAFTSRPALHRADRVGKGKTGMGSSRKISSHPIAVHHLVRFPDRRIPGGALDRFPGGYAGRSAGSQPGRRP